MRCLFAACPRNVSSVQPVSPSRPRAHDRSCSFQLSRSSLIHRCVGLLCAWLTLRGCSAKSASLLYPDGGYYIGPIDQSNRRHGVGEMFAADGKLVDSGTWINDQQQPAAGPVSTQAALVTATVAAAPTAAASVVTAPLSSAASSSVASAATVPPTAGFTASPSATAAAPTAGAASSPSSSSSASSALQPPNRKALLFGNSKYVAPVKSLRCCRNDAKDMQRTLTQLGFHCTRLSNASKKEMTLALRTFIVSLKRGDIVFLHFSGHGEESAGSTYLLPSDFGHGSLRDDAVNLNHIMSDFNQLDLDLIVIIVLDCCRANKEDATWKDGVEGGLVARSAMDSVERGGQSFVRAPSSGQFLIAYSSDPGTVSFETSGDRNGWFTGCLLAHLLTPDLRLFDVLNHAAEDLLKKSKGQQRAWVSQTPSVKLGYLTLMTSVS